MSANNGSEVRRKRGAAPSASDATFTLSTASPEEILEVRAALLAQEQVAHIAGDHLDVVVFQLAQESYAVETQFVREIFSLKDLTPVPCTPDYVLGVINLRGEICAVVDLKRLFGMPERGLTNATRAIVVRDGRLEFGIIADEVHGTRSLPVAQIEPPPPTLSGLNADFLRGVMPDGLIVLHAARILAHPSMIVREEVGDRA